MSNEDCKTDPVTVATADVPGLRYELFLSPQVCLLPTEEGADISDHLAFIRLANTGDQPLEIVASERGLSVVALWDLSDPDQVMDLGDEPFTGDDPLSTVRLRPGETWDGPREDGFATIFIPAFLEGKTLHGKTLPPERRAVRPLGVKAVFAHTMSHGDGFQPFEQTFIAETEVVVRAR
ncbi:hypothetical protein AADZ90_017130 [Aestuariibius sp. 2305UL40-4]